MAAASSISMAAASVASSSSSTSVRFHNRIINLSSFEPSSITITNLSPKPTTLKLKFQNPIFPLLSFLSPSHLCCSSATFDNMEGDTEDQQISSESEDQDEEEEEKEEEEESTADEGSRLYVGNLPYAMTANQLSDVFKEAGHVDTLEIVYDRVTDRSRGFAFVMMGSVQEAKNAIRMFDGSQVGGRTVKVNFPEVPRGGEREVMGPRIRNTNRSFIDSPNKIYAGNLGWGLTSQGLRDAFADQPGLLSAKVIYDRDSGRSRGFGFVSFASAEEAQSAIDAMNDVEVEGRPLRLNLAAEKATTSFQTEETKADRDLQSNEMLSSANT